MQSERSNQLSPQQDVACNPFVLGEFISALTVLSSQAELYTTLTDYLPKLIPADRASVALFKPGTQELRVYALQGQSDVLPVGMALAMEHTNVGRAILSRAVETQISDLHSSLSDIAQLAEDGFAISMCAPLIVSNAVLGTINVASRTPHLYTAESAKFLSQIASLIAIQLERQQLFEQTHATMEVYRLQAERLAVLNDIGRDLAASVSEADVFQIIAQAIGKMLSAHRISYASPRADRDFLKINGLVGSSVIPRGTLLSVKDTFIGKIFETGQPGIISDLSISPYPEHKKLVEAQLRVGWSIPIHIGKTVEGVLNVAAKQPSLDSEDILKFLNPLGQLMGATLARIRIQNQTAEALRQNEARLEYQAHHDALTGLPNRIKFHTVLNQALRHAEQENIEVAIAFLDLDNFKLVNDSLSHAIGDMLLCQVAQRIQSALRQYDMVARLGGDEFVVIWQHLTHPKMLSSIAQRIIDLLSQPFAIDDHTIQIGCSIGISLYPKHGLEANELIRHADLAMYQAKSLGRNRFQFFNDSSAKGHND